jgi:hypothetical protein
VSPIFVLEVAAFVDMLRMSMDCGIIRSRDDGVEYSIRVVSPVSYAFLTNLLRDWLLSVSYKWLCIQT